MFKNNDALLYERELRLTREWLNSFLDSVRVLWAIVNNYTVPKEIRA